MRTNSKSTTTVKVDVKNTETNTTEQKKRLSAFGKFMLENRGMVSIVDMKAVMQ
jgi:hypothetical protein